MGRWITKNGVHVYMEKESNDLASALAEHYGGFKLPPINLDKQEYGYVTHEINTWYKKAYNKKKIISKPIGNTVYTFENHGYNNYRFIGKDDIEELLDLWEMKNQ